MTFDYNEKKDLVFAGLMISLAFAILLSNGYKVVFELNSHTITIFFIALFTAGIGFLLHEIAHKITAQRYGLTAKFKAYYNGLWLALLFSLFGFIIAAPGAVYIKGRNITSEKNGKISLAGPLTNIILSFTFLILLIVFGVEGFLGNISDYGLRINSLLAVFNMLPIIPFDGVKIKDWNLSVYIITTLIAVGLFVLSLIL